MEDNYKDLRLVLIDDDKDFASLFKLKIESANLGLDLIYYDDPIEAVNELKKNCADALLVDYRMKTKDGQEYNGDKCVEAIREFDKNVPINLITGFSQEKPAMEMLSKLNIQGYIDKTADDAMILVLALLKTAKLIKTISKQEKIIDAQTYKDEFFGSFVSLIVEEIKNKSMAISGTVSVLEKNAQFIPNENKEEYNNFTNISKESIHILCELVDAINIGTESIVVKSLKENLEKLLKIDLMMKMATLNFEFENEYAIIECNPRTIVYILIEIIRFLIGQNITQVSILCKEENSSIKIKVCHKIDNKEIINKVEKLAILDEKITFEKEEEQIVIKIE